MVVSSFVYKCIIIKRSVCARCERNEHGPLMLARVRSSRSETQPDYDAIHRGALLLLDGFHEDPARLDRSTVQQLGITQQGERCSAVFIFCCLTLAKADRHRASRMPISQRLGQWVNPRNSAE